MTDPERQEQGGTRWASWEGMGLGEGGEGSGTSSSLQLGDNPKLKQAVGTQLSCVPRGGAGDNGEALGES